MWVLRELRSQVLKLPGYGEINIMNLQKVAAMVESNPKKKPPIYAD